RVPVRDLAHGRRSPCPPREGWRRAGGGAVPRADLRWQFGLSDRVASQGRRRHDDRRAARGDGEGDGEDHRRGGSPAAKLTERGTLAETQGTRSAGTRNTFFQVIPAKAGTQESFGLWQESGHADLRPPQPRPAVALAPRDRRTA